VTTPVSAELTNDKASKLHSSMSFTVVVRSNVNSIRDLPSEIQSYQTNNPKAPALLRMHSISSFNSRA
jgi:hypothetical protein